VRPGALLDLGRQHCRKPDAARRPQRLTTDHGCGDVDALTMIASTQEDYVPIRARVTHGLGVLEYLERSTRRHAN